MFWQPRQRSEYEQTVTSSNQESEFLSSFFKVAAIADCGMLLLLNPLRSVTSVCFSFMNDLNQVLEEFYRDVQRLHVECESLVTTIEIFSKRELEEKAGSFETGKGTPLSGDEANVAVENNESILESYLNEVIKKSGDLRIKNCKLDLEQECFPEEHELTSLISETRSSSQLAANLKVGSSSLKTAKYSHLRKKSLPSPVSAREKAKAYKPPPLPKKKSFQTTYNASYRHNTSHKSKFGASITQEISLENISPKNAVVSEVANSYGKDGEVCRSSTLFSEIAVGSEESSLLSSEASTLVATESCASSSIRSSLTKELSSVVDEKHKTCKSTSEEEFLSVGNVWPPPSTRKDKRKQFFEINSVPGEIWKLHQKLSYSSKHFSQPTFCETVKREELLPGHSDVFSRGREVYERIIQTDKILNDIEKITLASLSANQAVDPCVQMLDNVETILRDLQVSLVGSNCDSSLISLGRNPLNDIMTLKTFFSDSEPLNLPELFLRKVSKQDMENVELRFKSTLLHFELLLQQVISGILDDLSSHEHSYIGAAQKTDLLKFLYSIGNNDGKKLPSFVYNDT